MTDMWASSSVDEESEEMSSLASEPMPDPTPEALGRAVRQRRAELRMSQADVRAESGLSVTTISKIERGAHDLSVQRATMRRLDLAMQWPVGTAEAWYYGRGGVVDTPAGEAPDMVRWVEDLAPLVAEQLRRDRRLPAIAVDGLPEPVAVALEHLVAVLRTAFSGVR